MPQNQLADEQPTDIQTSDYASEPASGKESIKRKLVKGLDWLIIKRIRNSKLASFKQKFSELTLSQWFYLFAGILLFVSADKDVEADSSLIWVGVLAGIGLMRELWHVSNRLWDNMLGKGLILVLYAVTANFAVAIAALKINTITGIEPSPFVFTIAFTALLMLPFWLLMSSVVFFSVALVASNLWLILSVLLRIVRVKVKVHWEDKSFVFATMLLRIILIPYVIMSILYLAVPFAEQIEVFDNPITQIRAAINDEQDAETDSGIIESSAEVSNPQAGVDPNIAKLLSTEGKMSKGAIDKWIANFIFYFETYPKSACKKLDNQRSLPIDENLLLLAEKDDSTLGYKFSVGPCEGNFSLSNEQ